MKRFARNEKGFTLIELILVIVILGILAAVAIPRFIDLQSDARLSVVKGVGGALAGAITMLHAQYLIGGTTYTVAGVIGSIDSANLDGLTHAGVTNVITVTVEGATGSTWAYTEQTAAPGGLVGPT